MNIRIIPAYDHSEEVGALFSEYTDMLIDNDETFKKYLELQNYDEELRHLEVKYGMPEGRLYLLYFEEKLAGCIGLRKIDEQNCELKRLYVRPEFRGRHLGSILVEKIIEEAKKIGYSYVLLDTLPFLKSAIQLYEDFGFYEIDSYNDSPMDTSIYMKLNLQIIRPAEERDLARIAEILIFNYRLNFYPIFQNDWYYFDELQVPKVMDEYKGKLQNIWVYDDGVVKGFIMLEGKEIKKLFVEPVLQGKSIGKELLEYAMEQHGASTLWALEKNVRAIRFYERHGFHITSDKVFEEDTTEYLVRLEK